MHRYSIMILYLCIRDAVIVMTYDMSDITFINAVTLCIKAFRSILNNVDKDYTNKLVL